LAKKDSLYREKKRRYITKNIQKLYNKKNYARKELDDDDDDDDDD
jgi:hypothetical protein